MILVKTPLDAVTLYSTILLCTVQMYSSCMACRMQAAGSHRRGGFLYALRPCAPWSQQPMQLPLPTRFPVAVAPCKHHCSTCSPLQAATRPPWL